MEGDPEWSKCTCTEQKSVQSSFLLDDCQATLLDLTEKVADVAAGDLSLHAKPAS